LLATFVLIGAACGGDDDEADGGAATQDCTWTIGTMGALSGPAAGLGLRIAEGVELAVIEANEAGDLACELELVKEDSQGDPNQAPALADKLIQNETLVYCPCPYFSGETIATGAKFSQAGIAFGGTGTDATIDEQGFTTWHRAVAPDDIQAAVHAAYVTEVLGAESVAVVHDNQQYSKGLADGVVKELGGDLVVGGKAFVINPDETDYSAVVTQIADADPDAISYGGYYEEAGLLAKQLQEEGVTAQFLSDDGALDAGFGEGAGDAAAGVLMTCACGDPKKIEGAEGWFQKMRDEFGPPAPGTFAADMYDVTNIAIQALREYEGDPEDIDAVRQAVLEAFDNADGIQGVTKVYGWTDAGEFEGTLEDIWLYEWKNAKTYESLGIAQDVIAEEGG
jgi:branched-chain amino acid transport system substrate-binding protein